MCVLEDGSAWAILFFCPGFYVGFCVRVADSNGLQGPADCLTETGLSNDRDPPCRRRFRWLYRQQRHAMQDAKYFFNTLLTCR